MKYYYNDWLHPQLFWKRTVNRPLLLPYTPHFYYHLGMAYETAMWLYCYDLDGESIPVESRVFEPPGTVGFWYKVMRANGIKMQDISNLEKLAFPEIPLPTTRVPAPPEDTAVLVGLFSEALLEWPRIEANPLLFGDGEGVLCSRADYPYLNCCAFHERMSRLLFEQQGREYLLAAYYLPPEVWPQLSFPINWERQVVAILSQQSSLNTLVPDLLSKLHALWG